MRATDIPAFFGRGEPARRALLLAGAEAFGEHGLDGATTREIAARAGQNIAAIAYYFKSKEGLYLAIARELGAQFSRRVGPVADAVAQLPLPVDPAAALELLKQLLTVMIHTMASAEETAAIAQFIVREQQRPSRAFDLIYEGGMRRAHETVTLLVSVAFGLPRKTLSTVLRAHALIGQVIGFRVARAALLRRTGWRKIGEQEAAQVVDAVFAGLDLMFSGRWARQSKTARRSRKSRVRAR